MKIISVIISLFLLISCASKPAKNAVHDVSKDELLQKDVLIKESLQKTKLEYLAKLADSSYDLPALSALCYLKDFTRAKEKMGKVYEANRTNANYWNLVANCFLLQDDDYAATLYYKKSLDLNPKNVVASNNLGVLMLKKKNINRALKYFQEAHQFSPSSITPMMNLAGLYLYYGHSKRAALFFETLHSLAPLDVEVSKGLILSYALDGRMKEAKELLTKLPTNQKEYIDLQAHDWVDYIENSKTN